MQIINKITPLEILQEIGGDGRNSAVFVVKDNNLGRIQVAKFIDPADLKRFRIPKDRWFEEAKALHQVEHDRIIKLHCAGYSSAPPPTTLKKPAQVVLTPSAVSLDPWLVLTMPYHAQGSVAAFLKSQGGATSKQAIRWAQDALLGTGHIHGLGLLHLDVKPTNMLIDSHGRALLTDFGQSQWMDPTTGLIAPDKPIYTRHMPPELVSSGVASTMSDIYQVGLTAYRMVNGHDILDRQAAWAVSKYGQLGMAMAKGVYPSRDYFLPHVPTKLKSVIKKSLALDPRDRYASSFEFSQALGAVTQLLDWRCVSDSSDHAIFESNSKGCYEIVEIYKDGQEFRTRGKKTVSGSARNQTKWSTGAHKTRQKAEDALRRVFRQEA